MNINIVEYIINIICMYIYTYFTYYINKTTSVWIINIYIEKLYKYLYI